MNIKNIIIALLFFSSITHAMDIKNPQERNEKKETYFSSLGSITNSFSPSFGTSPNLIEEYSVFTEETATDMSGSLAFEYQSTPLNSPTSSRRTTDNENKQEEKITQHNKKRFFYWSCCWCCASRHKKDDYQKIG